MKWYEREPSRRAELLMVLAALAVLLPLGFWLNVAFIRWAVR